MSFQKRIINGSYNNEMLYILIGFLALVVGYLFVSRTVSPVPYFPSNRKDIKNIIGALHLSNKQVVYDLGAGDGVVIFSAASSAFIRKLDTKFIAVEINPVLLLVLWLRHLLHPNRKNIRIMYGDIFTLSYRLQVTSYKRIVFFTYISPWYLEKVYKNVASQVKKFSFISYFYPVPKRKSSRTIKGVHSTYVYNT